MIRENLQIVFTTVQYKITYPLLKRMRNVINFFELAAALPRSDGRVTAQYYRRARLHPRQPRSIYFSHDMSKEPRAPSRNGEKERGRKKQLPRAEMLGSRRESRTVPASCVLSVMIYCFPVHDSVSKIIANFQRVTTIHVLSSPLLYASCHLI